MLERCIVLHTHTYPRTGKCSRTHASVYILQPALLTEKTGENVQTPKSLKRNKCLLKKGNTEKSGADNIACRLTQSHKKDRVIWRPRLWAEMKGPRWTCMIQCKPQRNVCGIERAKEWNNGKVWGREAFFTELCKWSGARLCSLLKRAGKTKGYGVKSFLTTQGRTWIPGTCKRKEKK